jgi:integrase
LGQGQSLVFTGVTGARVSDVTLGRVMATLEKLANVPHITIHGLRHTFASVNLMRGVDIKDVSEQLGHEDIATTERHYRHYIPDDAEAVARRRRMAAEVWKVGGESAKG